MKNRGLTFQELKEAFEEGLFTEEEYFTRLKEFAALGVYHDVS